MSLSHTAAAHETPTSPQVRTLRVGMAQINTTTGDIESNARKIIHTLEHASQENVDLVVASAGANVVVTEAADDPVSAGPSEEAVVAATSAEEVGASLPSNLLRLRRPDEHVRAQRPDDRLRSRARLRSSRRSSERGEQGTHSRHRVPHVDGCDGGLHTVRIDLSAAVLILTDGRYRPQTSSRADFQRTSARVIGVGEPVLESLDEVDGFLLGAQPGVAGGGQQRIQPGAGGVP